MRFWDILARMDPAITPQATKIHLATHNGKDDPLRPLSSW